MKEPPLNRRAREQAETGPEPRYAPTMEYDELDEPATEEEIRRGDYTPYQALIRDYTE